MKLILRIFAIACLPFLGVRCLPALAPLALVSCQTAPNARVVQAQTILAVGQAADAAVALSAQLYRDGKITAAQARQVIDFYDNRLQPVYRLAAAAARSDLSSLASPDLVNLGAELIALVGKLQNRTQ